MRLGGRFTAPGVGESGRVVRIRMRDGSSGVRVHPSSYADVETVTIARDEDGREVTLELLSPPMPAKKVLH